MWTDLLLLLYCVAIVLASLAGGWLPYLIRLTHTRMQTMMSAVSGLMLGVAVLHLLPHSVEYLEGSMFTAAVWMLIGILAMFFLIRTFHFHQHSVAEEPAEGECDHDHVHNHHGGHDHDHSHHHHHGHNHGDQAGSVSWVGLALGLSLHTLIDGVALGAAMSAEAGHVHGFSVAGLGVFLAIVLHKPLDALSISSVMASDHWPRRTRNFVNAGFAMMCPLGALLFRFSVSGLDQQYGAVVGCALAFSAGVFLCISLGDLLPELQFHSHDRIKLSAALLLGVAIAVGIEFLPGHSHDHGEHDGHNHGSREPEAREPGEGDRV
ncbi:MAG: ZIP family metal transporter [Pirellulaceae bacterium]